jgi:hypothetical protein
MGLEAALMGPGAVDARGNDRLQHESFAVRAQERAVR